MYKSFKFNNMWRTFQWMLFSSRWRVTGLGFKSFQYCRS